MEKYATQSEYHKINGDPGKRPSLLDLINDFDPILDGMNQDVDRLARIADKLFGAAPTPARTNIDPSSEGHSIERRIERKIELLRDFFDRFRDEISRIENRLG
jgi:hypothetical protein